MHTYVFFDMPANNTFTHTHTRARRCTDPKWPSYARIFDSGELTINYILSICTRRWYRVDIVILCMHVCTYVRQHVTRARDSCYPTAAAITIIVRCPNNRIHTWHTNTLDVAFVANGGRPNMYRTRIPQQLLIGARECCDVICAHALLFTRAQSTCAPQVWARVRTKERLIRLIEIWLPDTVHTASAKHRASRTRVRVCVRSISFNCHPMLSPGYAGDAILHSHNCVRTGVRAPVCIWPHSAHLTAWN